MSVTPGPSPTGTVYSDSIIVYATQISQIGDLAGTPGVIYGVDGQPMDLADGANQIGANIGGFVGTIRSLAPFFAGKTGTLILFIIAVFIFISFVQIMLFIIPVIIKVF